MDVIAQIIKNRFLGSEMEIHDSYAEVVEYINQRTPTAYGKARFVGRGESCELSLDDKESRRVVLDLISEIQCTNNSNIKSASTLQDFVKEGERLVRVLYGGSAGQILLLEDSKGGLFVRKVAARFGVEGNGTPKLQAEIEFLLNIQDRPECEQLLRLYPRILANSTTDRFITLDQEFVGEGKNVLTHVMDGSISPQEHRQYVHDLLSKLIPNGYRLESHVLPEDRSLEQLEDYYLRRAEGRIRFLQSCGDFELDFPTHDLVGLPQLVQKEELKINGEMYRNPLAILDDIRSKSQVSNILRPRTESFCAHGDMTFLNMVFDTQAKTYKLIDNRGYIGRWDALYDFGKLKFTLSGFGQVMLGRFSLSEDKEGSFKLELQGEKAGRESLSELNASFFDDVLRSEDFKELVKDEPHWKERILFAEAVHYLSDIPHRLLLDQAPKNAVAVYLLGTIYLSNCCRSLKDE